ncbi:hypothetical protein BC834DRAFT_1039699 [Gloeopeniophorella convolvens]|nr:hypothetical protein BC834DRAFT_1039699 [Gloeopeniophorella convolvens]
MAPSVRVRRHNAYTSIREDDRPSPDPQHMQDRGRRALSEGAPPSPAAPAASSIPRDFAAAPPVHDNTHLTPNYPSVRRDMSRVNRHVRRSSLSFRSFATDPDSNISVTGSPPANNARLVNVAPQHDTIYEGASTEVVVPGSHHNHVHRASRVQSALSRGSHLEDDERHHDDDVVDHLDVIDPQVATVATLTNAANAILIPPLSFYSRKPVVVLPRREHNDVETGSTNSDSTDELDRHVHDVLKRRQKFRRVMKGVWAFLKTPLGIAFGIYGFLVVFWGTALVFFLAKWIDLHNQTTQDFWVEVCEQIEDGLFCLTGIGLIPWRLIDTYRIVTIWYYKRLTRKLRRKAGLPELYDNDDLPDPIFDPNYVHVLTDKQQYELHHQQKKFMKSQTWYRPHGTETHRAFPINTALWICLLNDGNSVFQCMLAACMWSMNRFVRPAWVTSLLIPAAFGCGIASGVLIWKGGKKTKRTERVEERLRRALEMDDSAQALVPNGAIARLQGGVGRQMQDKEAGSAGSNTPPAEKPEEGYNGVANGRRANGDYASTRNSSLRVPGIKIEEEMVVPRG